MAAKEINGMKLWHRSEREFHESFQCGRKNETHKLIPNEDSMQVWAPPSMLRESWAQWALAQLTWVEEVHLRYLS